MAYTAKDALQFVWPIVGQYGATHAIGNNNFLFLINHAINLIWNYEGYIWTWQHRKDRFTNLIDDGTGTVKLITTHPIRKIDKFFCYPMLPIDGAATACNCPPPPVDPCGPFCVPCQSSCGSCNRGCSSTCGCGCGCGGSCEGFKWTEVLPQNELCAGEYAITSSMIPGMGGIDGKTIRVKPNTTLNRLRVTYYRGPEHITNFNQILPIPDAFMSALSYYIAFLVLGRYGQYRAGEDANFLTIARNELDNLKKADNVFPDRLKRDGGYPFYGDAKSSLPRSVSGFVPY